jgi:hypothetical protein
MRLIKKIVIITVLFCLSIAVVFAGGVKEKEEPVNDALIWDIYMEYTKWCKENSLEPLTYHEWEDIREEMKNNPDAAGAVLNGELVLKEKEEENDQGTEDAGETLEFSSPEEEAMYNEIKEYYDSLSDLEKDYLKRIVNEETL